MTFQTVSNFTVAVGGVILLHDRNSRKESSYGAAWERAGTHPGGGCLVDRGVGRDPGAALATLGWQQEATLGETARFGPLLFQILTTVQLALSLFFAALLSASAVALEK